MKIEDVWYVTSQHIELERTMNMDLEHGLTLLLVEKTKYFEGNEVQTIWIALI